MIDAIQGRELFELDGGDALVRGTYHKAGGEWFDPPGRRIAPGRVGVVILNSTSPTRAANGDAAVYLADSIAERGYPAFRIDLPGFGDSEGEIPIDLLGFITHGGYAPVASAMMQQLVARYKLSGVIVVGHCAGSLSALRTAGLSRECRGVVMIGPYFHLPQVKKTPKIRRQLNLKAMQSRTWALVGRAYDFLSEVRVFLHRGRLPENANIPLIRCWRELASNGLPILVLKGPERKAPGGKSKHSEFDYFQYLLKLPGAQGSVAVRVTDGANNAFANRQGLVAIQRHIGEWLSTRFPVPAPKDCGANTPRLGVTIGSDESAFAHEYSELQAGDGSFRR
jgi:pimeloyl-ACP methyl ester carboxylesterase